MDLTCLIELTLNFLTSISINLIFFNAPVQSSCKLYYSSVMSSPKCSMDCALHGVAVGKFYCSFLAAEKSWTLQLKITCLIWFLIHILKKTRNRVNALKIIQTYVKGILAKND